MREFGSLAVFSEVSFFFIPLILAQKESRLLPPSGWGGFKFMPCFLAEARPLAFNPPSGFLPSLRVHAADLAIAHRDADGRCSHSGVPNAVGKQDSFTGQ